MFRGKQTPQSQCQKKSNLNLYLSKDIFSAVRLWYFVFYKEIQYQVCTENYQPYMSRFGFPLVPITYLYVVTCSKSHRSLSVILISKIRQSSKCPQGKIQPPIQLHEPCSFFTRPSLMQTFIDFVTPSVQVTRTGVPVQNISNMSVQVVTCSPDW